MRRWVGVSLAVVAAVAVAGLVWEPLSASDQAAPAKRAYDVEIVRDEFGVPHINGKTDADAAYGLAFAHSEDDFSTIQEVVSMARGRYGAMIGTDGAKVDFAFHLLGVRDTVDRRYAEIPADVRAVLDGYAAGLNHYADKNSKIYQSAKTEILEYFCPSDTSWRKKVVESGLNIIDQAANALNDAE